MFENGAVEFERPTNHFQYEIRHILLQGSFYDPNAQEEWELVFHYDPFRIEERFVRIMQDVYPDPRAVTIRSVLTLADGREMVVQRMFPKDHFVEYQKHLVDKNVKDLVDHFAKEVCKTSFINNLEE